MNTRDLLQQWYDHLSTAHGEKAVSPSASVGSLPYRNVVGHHENTYPTCTWVRYINWKADA